MYYLNLEWLFMLINYSVMLLITIKQLTTLGKTRQQAVSLGRQLISHASNSWQTLWRHVRHPSNATCCPILPRIVFFSWFCQALCNSLENRATTYVTYVKLSTDSVVTCASPTRHSLGAWFSREWSITWFSQALYRSPENWATYYVTKVTG